MKTAIDDPSAFNRLVEKNGLTGQVHDIDFISGLLLALASGPDLVYPSDWLPLVYTDEENEPAFTDEHVLRDFLNELTQVWNHWNDEIGSEEEELTFPSRYRVEEDDTPSASLSRFAEGVAEGYAWLQEDWENLFDELGETEMARQIDGIYGTVLVSTLVLADPARLRATMAEEGDEPPSTSEALTLIASGLKLLAGIGRSVSAPECEEQPLRAANPMRHVGRNDPCPCGSGKKYKKCCLN